MEFNDRIGIRLQDRLTAKRRRHVHRCNALRIVGALQRDLESVGRALDEEVPEHALPFAAGNAPAVETAVGDTRRAAVRLENLRDEAEMPFLRVLPLHAAAAQH